MLVNVSLFIACNKARCLASNRPIQIIINVSQDVDGKLRYLMRAIFSRKLIKLLLSLDVWPKAINHLAHYK